jgi:hypothetical protein
MVLLVNNDGSRFTELVKTTPNPAKDAAAVEIETSKEEVKKITIVNVEGKKIQSYSCKTVKGINRVTLKNIENWQSGLYYVIIQNTAGSITSSCKLIKE